MKVSAKKSQELFSPVELTIVFETQKELDAFTGLCSHSYIGEAMEYITDLSLKLSVIRTYLENNGGNTYSLWADFTKTLNRKFGTNT